VFGRISIPSNQRTTHFPIHVSTYLQRRILRPAHPLQHPIQLPNHRLHAAVKRRPLAPIVQAHNVFFAAYCIHFIVHERLGVVVVAPDAAVVAIRGLLEGFEVAGFDEDVICGVMSM